MKVVLAFPENLLGQLILTTIRLQPGLEAVPYFSTANGVFHSPLPSDFDIALIYADSLEHRAFGFGLLRRFRERAPQTKCVVIFDEATKELVTGAFGLGARGVLSTATCNFNQLCRCIAQVSAGQVWANSAQVAWLIEELASVPGGNSGKYRESGRLDGAVLSKRDIEIVHLLALGNTNRKIALTLSLSEHTVKNYLSRIFEKLGVTSRAELMAHAIRTMIEEPPTRNLSFSNKQPRRPFFTRRLSSSSGLKEEHDPNHKYEGFVPFASSVEKLHESPILEWSGSDNRRGGPIQPEVEIFCRKLETEN